MRCSLTSTRALVLNPSNSLRRILTHRGFNALAETVIGLFKTEVIHRNGPWRGFDDVEFATLEWVWWFNHQRLLEPLGYVPPAEFEMQYHDALTHPSARQRSRNRVSDEAGAIQGRH